MQSENNYSSVEKPIRGVIYARYSCDKQREESIEGQIRECRQFAKGQNIDIVNEYIDRAYSATNDQRPDFQRMISDSYSGKFDAVIVWKSDRFSRNRKQAMCYRDILKENKVKLLSATEPNIEGPAGILFESMNDGYNEYYVEEMKVKMRRGEKENVLEGKTNGGSLPYGYKRLEKYKVGINRREAQNVKRIFALFTESELTVHALAEKVKAMGILNHKGEPFKDSSLYHMLKNRKYIGEYHWGEVMNNAVPAIIDRKVFDKAQEKMKKNERKRQSFQATQEEFLLSGKAFCGDCHSLVIGETGTSHTGKVYSYYKCGTAKRRHTCHLKPIRKYKLESYVLSKGVEFLGQMDIDKIANAIHEYELSICPQIKELERSVADVKRKLSNLMNAIEAGLNPTDLKERYNGLIEQRDELEHNLSEEKCKNPVLEVDEIKWLLSRYRNIVLKNDAQKKQFIDTIINTVVLQPDHRVDVFYNLRQNTMPPMKMATLEGSTDYHAWSTKEKSVEQSLGSLLPGWRVRDNHKMGRQIKKNKAIV